MDGCIDILVSGLTIVGVGIAPYVTASQLTAQVVEPVDHEAIALIQEEALERSQIMEIAWHLTDLYGSRQTGSPALRAAAEWARDQMSEWGFADARLEAWGPFGPGWANERFYAHVIEPQPFPLIGYPESWTAGTDGWVQGEAVVAQIRGLDDLERYRGKLKGKFVLTDTLIETRQEFEPLPWNPRYTEEELEEWAKDIEPYRVRRQAWVEYVRARLPAK